MKSLPGIVAVVTAPKPMVDDIRFTFAGKEPRTIEELTYEERDAVFAWLLTPRPGDKPGRQAVVEAAMAYVAAKRRWEERGGYAPKERQCLHDRWEELAAAVEGLDITKHHATDGA